MDLSKELKDWSNYVMPFGIVIFLLGQTEIFSGFAPLAQGFYWLLISLSIVSMFVNNETLLENMTPDRREELKVTGFKYTISLRVFTVLMLAYFGWTHTALWLGGISVFSLVNLQTIQRKIREEDEYNEANETVT